MISIISLLFLYIYIFNYRLKYCSYRSKTFSSLFNSILEKMDRDFDEEEIFGIASDDEKGDDGQMDSAGSSSENEDEEENGDAFADFDVQVERKNEISPQTHNLVKVIL